MDSQLEEYEKLTSGHELKESDLKETISELNNDIAEAKQETQDVNRFLNEEKTFKLLAETKCKRLQEDIDLLKQENSSFKEQIYEYKDLSSQLSEDLNASEERCSEIEMSLKAMERSAENLKFENVSLKEETTQRLTHIHQIREANYQLNQELTEIKVCCILDSY